jgi:2,3-diaminopropionate biosynthesis protein SbnB
MPHKIDWRSAEQPCYVPADLIRTILSDFRPEIINMVADTYQCFYDGAAVNPDTYSLKFPHKTNSRINALPAYVGQKVDMAGIKWVASFPDNVSQNRQRASAVIVINSFESGYPVALLDGTLISSARTAASAALAARQINPSKTIEKFALYGAGIINREIINFLVDDGWHLPNIHIHDPNPDSHQALAAHCDKLGCGRDSIGKIETPESYDLISMATSALSPWYDFEVGKHQTILHVSLRDIVPHRLNAVRNIVDDVNHAVKANTSLHLLEQDKGSIPRIENYRHILANEAPLEEPVVVSAFGMGMLDVALACFVMDKAAQIGELREISGLLPDFSRW